MSAPADAPLCVIVGAGAQGRVTLDVWRAACREASFVFVDDDASSHGSKVLGAKVVGSLAELPRLAAQGAEVVIAVGNPVSRDALARRLGSNGLMRWGTPVHPSAVLMGSVHIGPGTVIFPGAVVNTSATLGAHVIVNTGVIVEHDCNIGDGVNLSPGVRMGGRVEVGARAFVSTGVTLAPRVRIGAGSVIGAGAVVVRDIPDRSLAHGVPARVVRSIDDSFDWRRLL